MKLYPQYTKNVRVKDKEAVFNDKEILGVKDEIEKMIDNRGRVLLRKSGTEPVVRVMTECETMDKCVEYAHILADKIVERGHGVE